MAVKSFFSKLIPRFGERKKQYTYARMLDGSLPIFTNFGKDIYASDVVQAAVNKVAIEISKLQPRHIRTNDEGITTQPKGDFNRLFKFKPNPLMTTSEFLEKMIWILYRNYNCFVYPSYDIVVDGNGRMFRRYTGFYPLNPTAATFLQDESERLFVKLEFGGGNTFTLPYDEVIHLRKKFSVNDILGGGRNGRPDNDSLLKVLEVEHTVLEGLSKAIPTSLSVRGVLRINSLVDEEIQETERKRFERAIQDGKSSILTTDLKSEYTPLEIDPKLVDKDTMAFLQEKILNWVGVPLKILTGNFSGDDYQIWYEQELEPLIIRMGQAFSSGLFTDNELNHGNAIVFYQRDLMYMSMKSKLDMLKTAGEQGLLTDNQKLGIIGYPPIPGEAGNRRTISLNFVSVDIVDEYQMKKAGVLKNWVGDDGEEEEESE
jgi:HK97 family phage portal protein